MQKKEAEKMSDKIANALIEALNDEYKARATYQCVIEQFGPIRPFINIIEAETRHIQALLPLFQRYGVPVPADDWKQRISKPESVMDACKTGVEAEIENAEMYDRLLKTTEGYPDIQRVMMNLQRASAENHLPAFQRCVSRTSDQRDSFEGCFRGGRMRRGGRGRGRNQGRRCF